jgi:hypothetical protein
MKENFYYISLFCLIRFQNRRMKEKRENLKFNGAVTTSKQRNDYSS